MAHEIVRLCRHPKEKSWGALMLAIGLVAWIAIAGLALLLIIGGKELQVEYYVIYAGGVALLAAISAALFRAHAFGHYVLIGDDQFPHLHRMLADGAARLGFDRTPRAFLYNSNGIFNAFARRLLAGRYVFLTSALVQAETDAQVRFVIGHELGHHAAGHLDWHRNMLNLPGRAVPFLYPAYSRGRELTCDRIGAYLAGDVQACRSALQMLACGCARLNDAMNVEAFEAQDHMVPPVAGWFVKLLATHPRPTRRVRELGVFAASLHAGADSHPATEVGSLPSPAE